ncbi:MAG: hypothetical protein ABUL60_35070 [Myxococcales bacterium]
MFARIPFASLSPWGRACLLLACLGLPLYASCTASEDTEPFVPAAQGAVQPSGDGDLVSEDKACARLLKAANAAYDRLGCPAPSFPKCPAFLRPGGGSGCYDYYDDSVSACEQAYESAPTCRELSPCLATAHLNEDLATCETVGVVPAGGAAGVAGAGADGGTGALAPVGGATGAGGLGGIGGAPPPDGFGGAAG